MKYTAFHSYRMEPIFLTNSSRKLSAYPIWVLIQKFTTHFSDSFKKMVRIFNFGLETILIFFLIYKLEWELGLC